MSLYRMDVSVWTVERVMFAVGGTLVVVCVVLAILLHPAFVWGAGFVGLMFVIFALSGYCPGAIIVANIMRKR